MLPLPTGRRGRLLALAMTAALAMVLWAGIARPLIAWHARRADLLQQKSQLAYRLSLLAQAVPALQQHASAAAARVGGGQDALLRGVTDALAGAELQDLLAQMAAAAGVAIRSTETLPAEPAATYRRVSVRLSATGAWPGIVMLLQAIDRAAAALLVDNLQLHGTAIRGRSDLPPIEASFTVSGFRASGGGGADQAVRQ